MRKKQSKDSATVGGLCVVLGPRISKFSRFDERGMRAAQAKLSTAKFSTAIKVF